MPGPSPMMPQQQVDPTQMGWKEIAPLDQMARGLAPVPPGPLTPLMNTPDPETNLQNLRTAINPPPAPEAKFPNLRTVDPSEVTKLGGPLDYMAGNAKRNAPQIGSMIGAGLAPGGGGILAGIASRMAGAGVGGGIGGAVAGKDPLAEGGKAMLGQGAGEALTLPLNLGMVQRAGGNLMRKMVQGNEAADTAFKEKGAQTIMDSFKKDVPSFADFPSDTKGLRDAVFGKGQELLSKSFDKALKEVVKQGEGQIVHIPEADAKSLGLKIRSTPSQTWD